MVVSGSVGFLRKNPQWGRLIKLRDTKIILDTTGAFYWYAKEQFLKPTSTYKYGTSMIGLGQFYRNLFKRFKERNVQPLVVYEGGRKSDRSGEIVSKKKHLENSARAALGRLHRSKWSKFDSLPQLAINCLKEVVNEFNLPHDQLFQADSEVYPLLVQLSRRHKCPVVTHHTDFIFQNVPQGFIRLDQVVLPTDGEKPIECLLYEHSKMLHDLRLTQDHSEALGCLAILLRDDFAGEYYAAINKVLPLESAGALGLGPNVRSAGNKKARLEYVLENWPRNRLTTFNSVRNALVSQATTGPHLTRDFDALRECYFAVHPFEQSELARVFSQGHDRFGNLNEVLTRRESSADFLTNAFITNFNMTLIEDTRTCRSTFSLQDRAKQYLRQRLRLQGELMLFDRRWDRNEYRQLGLSTQPQVRLDAAALFGLFHFDEKKLALVANLLRDSIQIDEEHSNRLALLLLLASFAVRLIPRENFNSNLEELSGPPSNSGSLGSEQQARQNVPRHYTQPETRLKFYTAIVNSYVYLQVGTSYDDQSRQDLLANIRMAYDKLDTFVRNKSTVEPGRQGYMTNKHLLEGLNSVLHAYKELNSLYHMPGPNILVNKYYDAEIIYKIMARYSNNLQEFILKLDTRLMSAL